MSASEDYMKTNLFDTFNENQAKKGPIHDTQAFVAVFNKFGAKNLNVLYDTVS